MTATNTPPAPHEGGDETVSLLDALASGEIHTELVGPAIERLVKSAMYYNEDVYFVIETLLAVIKNREDSRKERIDAAEARAASAEAEVARVQSVLAEKNELNRRLMEALSYEGKAVVVMRAIFGDNPIDRPSIEAPDDAAGAEA